MVATWLHTFVHIFIYTFLHLFDSLQNDLDRQQQVYRSLLEKNSKFRQRLNEVLPQDDGQLRDVSLLGGGAPISHIDSRIFVGDEDYDGAILQVEKLKNYINKLELQIYEMNEKVSELIENVSFPFPIHHHHRRTPLNMQYTLSDYLILTPADTAAGAREQELEGGKWKHEQRGQDCNGKYEGEHGDEQAVRISSSL